MAAPKKYSKITIDTILSEGKKTIKHTSEHFPLGEHDKKELSLQNFLAARKMAWKWYQEVGKSWWLSIPKGYDSKRNYINPEDIDKTTFVIG